MHMVWKPMAWGILAYACSFPLYGQETTEKAPWWQPVKWDVELKLPTQGGQQFWADELFCGQWRIQRNVLLGSCRLLDHEDWQHALGSFEDCKTKLDAMKLQKRLGPSSKKAVIVLHGLVRSRKAMLPVCRYLESQGKFYVVNVTYPSTRTDIAQFAKQLDSIIQNLDGVDEINFVGHSLGNIVIRHYLGDQTNPAEGKRPDPRLKRMVMLAPPNHGSCRADAWAENGLFQTLLGDAGQQLGKDWAKLEKRLATPAFEFGVVAGGRNTPEGWHAHIPGDDDGTISVATTRLAGARDFMLVPVLHTFVVNDRHTLECTLRFLQHGYFESEDQRHPIQE